MSPPFWCAVTTTVPMLVKVNALPESVAGPETSEKLIALAEKRASADKPLTESQKNYIRVAAMLEELVEEFSPKTKS